MKPADKKSLYIFSVFGPSCVLSSPLIKECANKIKLLKQTQSCFHNCMVRICVYVVEASCNGAQRQALSVQMCWLA